MKIIREYEKELGERINRKKNKERKSNKREMDEKESG